MFLPLLHGLLLALDELLMIKLTTFYCDQVTVECGEVRWKPEINAQRIGHLIAGNHHILLDRFLPILDRLIRLVARSEQV